MARIRTVKPEFYRHEELQDLEVANPGQYCMLVFQGLWTQCDNQGVFIDKPRQLKLDILPFIPFEMDKTISILETAGLLSRYTVKGKSYGIIPSLPDHQRFSGKEAGEAGRKYPAPEEADKDQMGKQRGSNGEALVKDQSFPNVQEVERERERERERKGKKTKTIFSFSKKVSIPEDFYMTEQMRAYAFGKGFDLIIDLDDWTEKFILSSQSKGYKYQNWEATWKNWLRDEAKKIQERPKKKELSLTMKAF